MHPHLIETVKRENICVECCPTSNLLLSYCRDLRTHPARALLKHGVKMSISPDDPGFFESPGVTLDYVVAYLAWDLNLSDLKQLCYNSIEFAAIPEEDKRPLYIFFEDRWRRFLAHVRGNH